MVFAFRAILLHWHSVVCVSASIGRDIEAWWGSIGFVFIHRDIKVRQGSILCMVEWLRGRNPVLLKRGNQMLASHVLREATIVAEPAIASG
jgi:hypothetical protein